MNKRKHSLNALIHLSNAARNVGNSCEFTQDQKNELKDAIKEIANKIEKITYIKPPWVK